MYLYSHIDEKKAKYLRRKEQLDKDFVWTEANLQNLYNLNHNLIKLQKKLAKDVLTAYKLFSKLEKNGMPFLHGFKVIGKISFEKEILNELYVLDKPTKSQEKIIDKWEDIAYFSSEETEAWQLIFDSEIKDFMPLSKIRLKEKRRCFGIHFPYTYYYDKLLCSYFAHFIDYNTTLSFEDLANCTIKDFSTVVTVILNYDVSELRRFSNYPEHHYEDNNFIYNMLVDRQHALDTSFVWTPENVQKTLEVNSWIWKKSNELKQYISELNSAFNHFSQTDPSFKNYSIEGQIEYHGTEANDIATLELQKEMSRNAAFNYSNLIVDESRQEIEDSSNEDESLKWNFEVFRHHLTEEQLKIRFHYFMHAIFVDDHIYSYADMVRMRKEDFKVCLEINWSGG